jgi:subtilisin family serine protease
MENRKIIVSFENGLTPKKALNNESVELINTFERLYEITTIVTEFKSNNQSIADNYSSDEILFQEEIFFSLTSEEKNIYSVFISRELELEVASETFSLLENNELVKYVQYDEENSLYETPSDPYYNQQWGLKKINCEKAWKYSTGKNIVIAVIDTGVDHNNPDIQPNLWKDSNGFYGYDFSQNDRNTMDYKEHGTHVAGIIGALNNQIQVASVAPNIKIMPVKIFPKAYDSRAAKAIKYAVDNGAKVINNSWGPSKRRPSNRTIEEAIDYAYSKGTICVFAAGNENDDVKYYSPANHPNVIAVGSTDKNDKRSPFSNYGKQIKVSAPGSYILSLKKGSSKPTFKSGTSMAAPFVSGTVGLIFSINPKTTSTDILLSKIERFSDTITTDKPIGKRLNAGEIVFNDPANFILFEKQISDTHRGVTGCCSNRQNQAWKAANRWFNKIKNTNPTLKEVYKGHGAGRAHCSSGRRASRARWCKTTVDFRAYIMMRK